MKHTNKDNKQYATVQNITDRINKERFFDSSKLSDSYTLLDYDEKKSSHGGIRLQGQFKSNDKQPLITIITAVYNGDKYLEEMILSVLNQKYNNVELIIIDGGSTDGTLRILEKYNAQIDYWLSEPDKGISDAFNKAILLASGDYINFQGDGDGFYDIDVLERLFAEKKHRSDLISGLIERIDENGKRLYVSKYTKKFNKRSLLTRMSLPHQGLFTSMDFFRTFGLFDITNKYCMDYEHLLRAYHDFPEVETNNLIIAKWRADGLGNNQELKIFKEYHKIKVDNNVTNTMHLHALNIWTLTKYYIKKIFL